jgi:hypothetical protein
LVGAGAVFAPVGVLALLFLLLDPQPLAQNAAASNAAVAAAKGLGVWGLANMNRPLSLCSLWAEAQRLETF